MRLKFEATDNPPVAYVDCPLARMLSGGTQELRQDIMLGAIQDDAIGIGIVRRTTFQNEMSQPVLWALCRSESRRMDLHCKKMTLFNVRLKNLSSARALKLKSIVKPP